MKETILITGGTGFIGQKLVPMLQAIGYNILILTRNKNHVTYKNVVSYESIDDIDSQTKIDAIINLAGAPINKRWSTHYKELLITSRVQTTQNIVALIQRLETKPHTLISASAIGYYGAHGNEPLDESSTPHEEFTHTLCSEWEEAASKVAQHGVRLCIARLGVVLDKNGGALRQMLPAFKLCLGGRLGGGNQIFSWIHRDDVAHGFEFLLRHKQLEGAFNFCAPKAVTNAKFTKALAHALNRPAIIPMPAQCVRLLFGEMGDTLLLHGQNVVPTALQKAGFAFTHNEIESALESSIK
jgi:uncharacterized protein (TIGR01777 family)